MNGGDGAKIIVLADAAARRRARGAERLRMSIDGDGDWLIRINNGPQYAVPAEQVEQILESLLRQARAARYKKLGLPAGPPVPKHERSPRRFRCARRRDGGLRGGPGGCRRRQGHEGQCSDKAGRYTPAICMHIGRGIAKVHDLATNTHRAHCRHCNADVGPCDPTLPPFFGDA